MFRNFDEIEQFVLASGVKKKIAVANSHDEDALMSAMMAYDKGIADFILIGEQEKTCAILAEMGKDPANFEIVDIHDDTTAARLACEMVALGKADIPMKGILHTAVFLKAVLDKTYGFAEEGSLLSEVTILEFTKENRFLLLTDCAINIAPDFEQKCKIIGNAVKMAHQLGIECPRAAIITPLEVVNPKIRSTVDAAALKEAAERGMFPDCYVDGPLALDNAMSFEAAKLKGIKSMVAGQADILVLPDLCTGNAMTKAMNYFTEFKSSGNIGGIKIPVIFTSRSDFPQNKYNSILFAVLQSIINGNTQHK